MARLDITTFWFIRYVIGPYRNQLLSMLLFFRTTVCRDYHRPKFKFRNLQPIRGVRYEHPKTEFKDGPNRELLTHLLNCMLFSFTSAIIERSF